jgi:metallo-beta-lactamase class B
MTEARGRSANNPGKQLAMTKIPLCGLITKSTPIAVFFVAAVSLGNLPAHAEAADPAAMNAHIAAATAAASERSDLTGPLALCQTATGAPASAFMDNYRKMVAESPLPPMQVFDNLYFLGAKWTTAWAIKTSDGIIIVDAMDNADEAEHYIEGGLRKLGVDPAQIKYVIVSHAHGDHYGGADYLKRKFNARVVMSEIDWQVLDKLRADLEALKKVPELFGPPPERDLAVKDGDTLTLGDTVVKLDLIPGHTLGTLASLFTVRDHGEPHQAVAWGGTAYNFGPLPDRLQIYADTTTKYTDLLGRQGVDIVLSNHVTFDAAEAKMAALKDRKAGEPNPFVVGEGTVSRFLTILGECALATKASLPTEAGK